MNKGRVLSRCWVVALAMGCLWGGQAHAQGRQPGDKTQWGVGKSLGESYQVASFVAPQQTRLVLYRNPTSNHKGVVSVYMNERYHTSLQDGGYAASCVTDQEAVQLSAHFLPTQQSQESELETTYKQKLANGKEVYVRFTVQASGAVKMESVTEDVAERELSKLKAQMHTFSRSPLVSVCLDEKSQADTNAVTLGADIEFYPNKSDYAGILPRSQRELSKLVERVGRRYKAFNQVRVQVMGYATDGSSDEDNLILARRRAQTVSQYVLGKGIASSSVVVDAVVTKGVINRPEGNRRVAIEFAVFVPKAATN